MKAFSEELQESGLAKGGRGQLDELLSHAPQDLLLDFSSSGRLLYAPRGAPCQLIEELPPLLAL